MSFDINSVLNSMKNAAVDAVKDDIGSTADFLKKIFENEKDALEVLAEARITGEITDKEFQNELEREKKVFEVEMLTISIMTKAIAQKAANAAIEVLENAVKMTIGLV